MPCQAGLNACNDLVEKLTAERDAAVARAGRNYDNQKAWEARFGDMKKRAEKAEALEDQFRDELNKAEREAGEWKLGAKVATSRALRAERERDEARAELDKLKNPF